MSSAKEEKSVNEREKKEAQNTNATHLPSHQAQRENNDWGRRAVEYSMLLHRSSADHIRYVYMLPHQHFVSFALGVFEAYAIVNKRLTSITRVRVAVLWVIAVAITTLVCLFPYAWDSASIPYDRVLAALYASLYPVLWSVSVSWMLHSCITGTAVLWVIAVAITTLVCLFPYAWDSASIPYDRVLAALYASLYPVLWSVSVSWMLHSCITGTAGLVNRFLSMGVFIPLGKLSFSLYLVHPYVLYMKVVTIRQFRALDQWTMLTRG
ncbi:hypothetical protein HPB51_002219 [Rhipicephalus microplus]|uniref:Uncharacterized protein n=1 Tax=Rhipicephalus microplus TaxID=6941 RepID=A0A9J6EEL6_RHIMP|nr:hypothetical protein HPB51_002219 [Rhipicephalus microplus]